MKIHSIVFLLFICFFGNAQVENYEVGDVVTDFSVTDTNGVVHNLYSITAQGKYVFLDFFFVGCFTCRATQHVYNEFYDKYGCNEGQVYCLSINSGVDNDEEVIAYDEEFGGPYMHAPAASMEGGSGAVDLDFGVNAYPTFAVINPNNVIEVLQIWPVEGVSSFEDAFPEGFDPPANPCTILGSEKFSKSAAVIYPNPSNGIELNLQLTNYEEYAELVIYNVHGIVVQREVVNDPNVSLTTNLKSGTYFMIIEGSGGKLIKKFIVDRML